MVSDIWSPLKVRRAAMLEAEAVVVRFGSRGVEAQTFSCDPSVSEARREYYRRVARIAERRQRELQDLDVATRYCEMARWQHRRGSLVDGGHSLRPVGSAICPDRATSVRYSANGAYF